jgi:hypothetical protein
MDTLITDQKEPLTMAWMSINCSSNPYIDKRAHP